MLKKTFNNNLGARHRVYSYQQNENRINWLRQNGQNH
jgi:hypothetical protein